MMKVIEDIIIIIIIIGVKIITYRVTRCTGTKLRLNICVILLQYGII